MSNKTKGNLDAITFIYGFGAAVVLVGAMFKFLGWQFANELFIVGLSIEALVFMISAFERQTDEKEYQWENVFPQLENGSGESGSTAGYKDAMDQFSSTLKELSGQLKDVTGSLQQIKSELESSAQNSADMKVKMNEFNQLMENYNGNLKTINEKYNNILNK